MPRGNRFRHQHYTADEPAASWRLVRPEVFYPQPGSEDFDQRMQRVGDVMRAADVAAIYLVHGTFMGHDALGFAGEIGRFFPGFGGALQRLFKGVMDNVAGDIGNYSDEFARRMQAGLNRRGRAEIPVRRFRWSGENDHVGRADGAVRLLDDLASRAWTPGQRVLLWGHSHGGNVFALLTNLLAADTEGRDEFFSAARAYFRSPITRRVDQPHWERVKILLDAGGGPLGNLSLDIATFGTPIRYGWDTGGCAKLLHFVNHRPEEGHPPYRTPFPPTQDDVLRGLHGDAIHHLAVAGTNFWPSPTSYRALLADRALDRLLQDGVRRRDILERLKAGMRVAADGMSFLVDYGPAGGDTLHHLAGHAVYTRQEWMLFHAEQIAAWFYQGGDGGRPAVICL